MSNLLWQTTWLVGGFSAAILLPVLVNLFLAGVIRGLKRTPVFAA